jgi:hypothetical protein
MITPADVDAVVQAVLAELARRNGQPRHAENGQVFAGKLLGQAQVELLDAGVQEIKVNAGTVVTPLARDLLKRRGITLHYASGSTSSKGTGEWAFAIEGRPNGKEEALRTALLHAWAEVAPEVASHWVVERPQRGALFLTPEASLATWRANRVDGVRAASASDVDAVARAVQFLGVNLLVVEPSGLSIASVKAMADTFCRAGAPAMPEGLR